MAQGLRVLVTGSSGFTGKALIAALEAGGHTVFGLTRTPEEAYERQADLLDPASLPPVLEEADADVVIHLAGITFAAHPSVSEIYEANILGGVRLLEALQQAPRRPSQVLVASSATVYAPADDGAPITEDHPLVPLNHYGASKRALEDVCRLFSAALPIQVLRPFNYTGPGQSSDFLVPKIVDHFARDAGAIELGNMDLDRDISSLDDVVETYVRLVRNKTVGAPLNICSGRTIRLSTIIDLMREITLRPMSVQTNPRFVRANEPKSIVGSREQLQAAVGAWTLQDFRTTLQDMYDFALSKLAE